MTQQGVARRPNAQQALPSLKSLAMWVKVEGSERGSSRTGWKKAEKERRLVGREQGKGGGKSKQDETRCVDGTSVGRLLTTDGENCITSLAGTARIRSATTGETKGSS